MTDCSTFSEYATRLREFIHCSERATGETGGDIESAPAHLADHEFNQLALELFALQFAHNVPYRRFCQERGVAPEAISDWTNIPAIPTSAFKDLELTSLPANECAVVFHSSGSTEQRPSRHFHNPVSLGIYEASLLTWFAAHVLRDRRSAVGESCDKNSPSPRPSPPGEEDGSFARDRFTSRFRIVSLTPSATEAPHSSLIYMFETIRWEFGSANSVFVGNVARDGTWVLDLEQTFSALRESSNQPVVLLGTAFGLVHLLDAVGENNIRLAPGSRVLETGGYKGRSREIPKVELHALITQRLGVPPTHIICEYGMSELSSQAYDGRSQKLEIRSQNLERVFRFPSWARAKIISPETGREVGEGETGLIRVFDLANVYSVMAIQTEDLGIRRGDGFELIGRAKAVEPRGCSLMTN